YRTQPSGGRQIASPPANGTEIEHQTPPEGEMNHSSLRQRHRGSEAPAASPGEGRQARTRFLTPCLHPRRPRGAATDPGRAPAAPTRPPTSSESGLGHGDGQGLGVGPAVAVADRHADDQAANEAGVAGDGQGVAGLAGGASRSSTLTVLRWKWAVTTSVSPSPFRSAATTPPRFDVI